MLVVWSRLFDGRTYYKRIGALYLKIKLFWITLFFFYILCHILFVYRCHKAKTIIPKLLLGGSERPNLEKFRESFPVNLFLTNTTHNRCARVTAIKIKINRYLHILYPGFQRRVKFPEVYIRTSVKHRLTLKKESNSKLI